MLLSFTLISFSLIGTLKLPSTGPCCLPDNVSQSSSKSLGGMKGDGSNGSVVICCQKKTNQTLWVNHRKNILNIITSLFKEFCITHHIMHFSVYLSQYKKSSQYYLYVNRSSIHSMDSSIHVLINQWCNQIHGGIDLQCI